MVFKRISIIILLALINFSYSYSQSAADKVLKLNSSKDYEQARAFIQDAMKEKYKDAKFLEICGDIYFELEKYDSSLICYQKAYNEDSEAKYNRKIALSYSKLGKHKEALEILRKMKSKDNSVESYYALGQAYINADSITQAKTILTQAVDKDDKNAMLYLALGDLYFKTNVYPLAQSNYEKALELNENLTEAREKLAFCYYWQGNGIITQDQELGNQLFTSALKQYEIITKKDPKNAKAYYQKGLLLFYSKKYPEAIKELYSFIALRPSSNQGRWMLAQSLYETGLCDSAAPHLLYSAENIDSVKVKAKLLLARCYFDKKNFVESSKIFQSLKSNGELTDMKDIERYARAVFQTLDTNKAVEIYKEILSLDPSKCQLAMQIGTMLLVKKDYEGSIWFYDKFINNCKSDTSILPKVYFYMGLNHLYSKRPDTAIYYFMKNLELDKENLNTRLNIGDAYAQLEKIDSAKLMFLFIIDKGIQDTAKYNKELSSAYSKTSSILLKEKSFKELNKIAKAWTEYDNKSAVAFLYLGISYQGLTDKENACKNFKRVLQIDPKNENARNSIKNIGCD